MFVYETLSAGGVADAALLAQGRAMRDAVAADLAGVADCGLTLAVCGAAPSALGNVASEGVNEPGVPEQRTQMAPIKAQSAAVARATASICNAEWCHLGVMSGHVGFVHTFSVEAAPGESHEAFVARQAERHDAVWAIAPESDGCLAALERSVRGRARWVGCSAGAIALASSKAATVERLAARAIATPLAFAEAAHSRWVVKPDDGAGAIDTRVHADRAAALADVEQRRGAWMEPWIEGDALSLSLLCSNAAHVELLSVNRQRISIEHDGSVRYGGVEIDVLPATHPHRPALAALAERIAAAMPGLRGYVGVDLVWHAQRGPVVIEVNPRLTCAYVGLSQRLGRNLGAEILQEALHA